MGDRLEELRDQAKGSPGSLAAKQALINGLEAENAELREKLVAESTANDMIAQERDAFERRVRELGKLNAKNWDGFTKACRDLAETELRWTAAAKEAGIKIFVPGHPEAAISALGTALYMAERRVQELEPQPCCMEWHTCLRACLPLAENWRMAAKKAEAALAEANAATEVWQREAQSAQERADQATVGLQVSYGPPKQDYAGGPIYVTSVEGNTIGVKVRTAELPHRKPSTIIDSAPDEQQSNMEPASIELIRRGFMDGIDWQHHLGINGDQKGASVYPSVEACRREKSCLSKGAGCGIVDVEVRLVKWAEEQDLSLEVAYTEPSSPACSSTSAEPVAEVATAAFHSNHIKWLSALPIDGTKLYTAPPSLAQAVALAVEKCAKVCDVGPIPDFVRKFMPEKVEALLALSAAHDKILALAQTITAEAAAGKWVPLEPTIFERRCLEGKVGIDWLEGWKSMLAAAPETEKP